MEAGCEQVLHHWRQCPLASCRHDIAYCEEHGGEDRAVREMRQHIGAHDAGYALPMRKTLMVLFLAWLPTACPAEDLSVRLEPRETPPPPPPTETITVAPAHMTPASVDAAPPVSKAPAKRKHKKD